MILVVGGTGFVGKTLLVGLHEAGIEAVTVSRKPQHGFLKAHLPGTRALSLQSFFKRPKKLLSRIEGCVYLASSSRLGDHRDTPWHEAQRTLAPLMRMLHVVCNRTEGPLPIVYLSSAAVYGRQEGDSLVETMAPNPGTPYGTGKVMAEIAVASAGRQSGCPTRILRPSTPIGRWQAGNARGAVGALMDAAETGATFFLNGDGSAVRDFFDARDLAQAIIAALRDPTEGHALWNVGAGTGTSMTRLIGAVQEATGRPIAVEHRPMPSGEVSRAVLDIDRIGRDLGWAPKTPLRTSLADIWAARQAG